MANQLKDVMAYLIKNHKDKLSKTAMCDLVYQADLYHVKDHGRQIMKTKWRRSRRDGGPFVPDFQKAAEKRPASIFAMDEKKISTPRYVGVERNFF